MNAPRIVLAGGGTGGHVIPAIAVAEEIVRLGGTARFVGTRDRLEATLVPKAGFEIDFVDVKPLVGGSLRTKLIGAGALPLSVLRSAALLRKIGPDAVMGVGGYVAGPVVFAAFMMGIPTALLEQNATVGLTNRLLAGLVKRAFVTYENTVSYFPKGRAFVTGNPVKSSILKAASLPKARCESVRILVMGGSQGAGGVDERVPKALGIASLQNKIRILHQCGKGNEDSVRQAYLQCGIEAEVVRFIDDTATAYRNADLVIARSGATTVAELTVMALPAVFLPYPHHKDRQQEKNALLMKDVGAALILDEKRSSDEELAAAAARFVNDEKYRNDASAASAALGKRDAANIIVSSLFEMCGGGTCSRS